MAEIIRLDTGVKEFTINDAVTVRFAPTDMTFIEKVYNALEAMDKKQEAFNKSIEGVKDAEIFKAARRFDEEARAEINGVFGVDICTPIMGDMNVITLANGFPAWANILLAIIEQFEGDFAEQKKHSSARLAKYTAKYKR